MDNQDLRRYFQGMRNAQPFGRGRYIVAGLTRAALESITIEPSRDPKKPGAINFIAKHAVIAFAGMQYTSVRGNVVNTANEFSPGDAVTHYVNLADPMYGLINAKEYLAPIGYALALEAVTLGEIPAHDLPSLAAFTKDFDDDDAIAVVGTNAYAGMVIDVRAWHTVTRGDPARNKPPADFTAREFKAYPRIGASIPPFGA